MPYVVAVGWNVGVYDSWEQVLLQIHNHPNPKFIKFDSEQEAEHFLIKISQIPQSLYAVAVGRRVGIYNTWEECKAQVDKFSNARYKKFYNREEAENFIQQYSEPEQKYCPPAQLQERVEDLANRVQSLEGTLERSLGSGKN